jgi:hypothetical protein
MTMPEADKADLIQSMLASERIMREASGGNAPMPKYRCHKEVWALKIKEVIKHAHPDPLFNDAMFEASPEFQGAHLFIADPGYAPIPVDADWYRKHDPQPGGYYVVYEDGYKSFSPAEAFEKGYTRL